MAGQLITVIFLLAIFTAETNAQIPKLCTQNATVGSAVCCPTPPGFAQACGGPGRGRCVRIQEYEEDHRQKVETLMADDRLNWPHRFFHYSCECEGNFMGYMCNECKFGYTGAKCDVEHVPKRRNVMLMSPREKAQFRRVVAMSKTYPSDYAVIANVWDVDPITEPKFHDVSVYDYFVFMHQYASRETVTSTNGEPMDTCSPLDSFQEDWVKLDFAHNGPGFLTWHRLFLKLWERAMQTLSGEDDFTFPYWDWVDKGSLCEPCVNDIVGATDYSNSDGRLQKESPFAEWITVCQRRNEMKWCRVCNISQPALPLTRIPAVGPLGTGKLPDQRQVNITMRQKLFYQKHEANNDYLENNFAEYLEGTLNENETLLPPTMHGEGHYFFWGHMGWEVAISPNDPVFILHHTFVDKLFEEWYRHRQPSVEQMPKGGLNAGHNRNSAMVPFIPVWINSQLFTDSRNLGYDYEEMDFWRGSDEVLKSQQQSFGSPQLAPETNSLVKAEETRPGRHTAWIGLALGLLSTLAIGMIILMARKHRRKTETPINVEASAAYGSAEETVNLLSN